MPCRKVLLTNRVGNRRGIITDAALWLNPWAVHPLDTISLQSRFVIRKVSEETGQLEQTDGMNFSGILNLDESEWERIFASNLLWNLK